MTMIDRPSPPSPYQQYLGTNYTPPEFAANQILDYLQGPRQELTSVKEQIRLLLIKQAEVEDAIHAHEALAHPIRRLPHEVLQLIFFACLPTKHYPTMGRTEAPLVLTQVCRSWRALALDISQLWASVHIVATPVEKFGKHEASFRVDGVEEWLERSKNLPLSLSIYGPSDYEPRDNIDHEFIRSVSYQASRIRAIRFHMSEQLLETFIGACAWHRGPWPSLERIEIKMNLQEDEGGHSASYSPTGVFAQIPITYSTIFEAPSLRSLTLHNFNDDVMYLRVEWEHIEDLRVGGLRRGGDLAGHTPRDCWKTVLIRSARSPDTYFGISTPPEAEITLSHLVNLDLMDIFTGSALGDQAPISFLSNLQLPSARTLTYDLRVLNLTPSSDEKPLPTFLSAQHSPVPITRFTVRATSIGEENLVKCLKLMPLLEYLSTQQPDFLVGESEIDTMYWEDTQAISASFFSCLHEDTQRLCPRLTRIRIELSTISLDGLRTALETQAMLSAPHTAAPFARLQKVHVGLTEKRPTFVPGDPGRAIDGTTPELAQCSLEEDLKDSGVDAKIILRCHPDPDSSIYRPFNPRLGLPTDPWSHRL